MKRVVYCAVLALSVIVPTSCNNETGNRFETVQYDIADFKLTEATFEEVEFSKEFIHAKTLYVYSDSVLIVSNKASADYFLELYNLNTEECIAQFIRKGNGPREMINAQMSLYGNILVVDDIVKMNFVSIDLDRVINERDSFELDEFRSYGADGANPVAVYPMDSDKLLFMNQYCFDSKELKIFNNEPRFYYNEREFRIRLVDTFNVSQGKMQINRKDSLIVYASNTRPEMELYDFGLNPLRKVVGPTEMHVSYRRKSLAFNNHVPEAYMGLAADDGHIYATYVGNQRDNALEESQPYTYILRYDWDCRLTDAVLLPLRLDRISPTSRPDVFYVCSGIARDTERILYKVTCTGWTK